MSNGKILKVRKLQYKSSSTRGVKTKKLQGVGVPVLIGSNEKILKITKQARAIEGYKNTYKVEILKLFNSELQLRDTEPAIKNKLKKSFLNQEDLKLGQH